MSNWNVSIAGDVDFTDTRHRSYPAVASVLHQWDGYGEVMGAPSITRCFGPKIIHSRLRHGHSSRADNRHAQERSVLLSHGGMYQKLSQVGARSALVFWGWRGCGAKIVDARPILWSWMPSSRRFMAARSRPYWSQSHNKFSVCSQATAPCFPHPLVYRSHKTATLQHAQTRWSVVTESSRVVSMLCLMKMVSITTWCVRGDLIVGSIDSNS